MNFNYETQGAITYLVCELEATDQLDSLSLGMLTNNHIVGLAPFIYTEMNGQRYLKYNISAKISIGQFLGSGMDKQHTLMVFKNILDGICSADEYMIEKNCFSLVPEHIFLNVSNCETGLICVPVVTDKNVDAEIANLFNNMLASVQPNPNEDSGYITQITAYVSNPATCTVYGLRDLITNLQASSFATPGFGAPNLSPQQQMGQPQMAPTPVQPQVAQQPIPNNAFNQPSTSVSSFDATITMEQMNERMQQATPPVAPASPVTAPVPPVQPVTPPVAPSPSVPPVTPPVAPQVTTPPVNRPVAPVPSQQPQTNGMPNSFMPAQKPAQKKSPAPGFAIPGQADNLNVPMPGVPSANKKEVTPQGGAVKADGDKKISLFGLLANYNKENAELYKSQKKQKKEKAVKEKPQKEKKNKASAANSAPVPPVQNPGVPGVPGVGQAPVNNGPMGAGFTPPQAPPIVQPVPVQNSFNETTVLSALGGETTVLGEDPAMSQPCLIRIKTGERIVINKPVFRIGKEKSYVDYFISDNTAISRSHANVHTENNEYFIEDTNSTNHTYLNGKIITSNVKTKLTSGDKVRLANEDFTFTV